MTGAQFDSAAQAQLQQHDKFQYQGSPKNGGGGGGAASSSSALSHGSGNAAAGPSTPTHYVVAQHGYSSGGGASVDSGSGLNASLQLLSKYDAPDSADGRLSASPKLGAAGDEEPKTHDRRLL